MLAEKLCGRGACFYTVGPRFDGAMINTFVLSHVVPNVRKRLPDLACLVLGRALLWLICSQVVDNFVSNDMKESVLSDWAHVRCSVDVVKTTNDDNDYDDDKNAEEEQEINPIRQEAVTVSGDHGAVFIDTIGDLEVGGAGAAGMNVSVRNQLLGLQSCLLSMRQGNLELKNAVNTLNMKMERGFGIYKRECSTNCDATRTDCGGGGDDSKVGTKSSRNGTSAGKCWGRPCGDDNGSPDGNPRSLHDL